MKITCKPSCAVISKMTSIITVSLIFQQRTEAQQDDRPNHDSQKHREGSVADQKHTLQIFQRAQPEDSEFQIPQTWLSANLGCFLELLVTCQSTLTY
jgi:hypothetical protein